MSLITLILFMNAHTRIIHVSRVALAYPILELDLGLRFRPYKQLDVK